MITTVDGGIDKAGILPLMNLGMPIPEGETACVVMVTGGKIDDTTSALFGEPACVTVHFRNKVAVIYTALALVKKNEGR